MLRILQPSFSGSETLVSSALDEQHSQDASQAETPTSSPSGVSRRSSVLLSQSSLQSRHDCFSLASSDSIGPAPNIPAVLDLLFSNDSAVQAVAAGTLKTLATEPTYSTTIRSSIRNLVELLQCSTDATLQESILGTLKHVALHDLGSHDAIAAAGGIKSTVQLLSVSTSSDTQAEAAALLLALAHTPAHITAIASAGAIPILLQLLCVCSTLRAVVLRLLAVMATHSAARVAMVVSGGAPALLGLLNSNSSRAMCSGSTAGNIELTETQELVASAISSLALEHASHADIIAWGGIQLLVELIIDHHSTGAAAVQGVAATALGRLAVNTESRAAIAAAGGVSALLQLLRCEAAEAQAAACRALSTLAADASNRTAVADGQGVAEIASLLASPHESVQFRAAQALQNLAVDPDIGHRIASAATVQQLVGFLDCSSLNTAADHDECSSTRLLAAAAGCLSNLAYDSAGCAAVAAVGGIEKLVQCLGSEDSDVLGAAAGALAKLAWEVQHCASIVSAGAVKALVGLLRHDSSTVLDAATVALENLTYDSPDIRLAIADESQAIPLLVQLLDTGTERVQKHAASVLHNLAMQRSNRQPIAAAGAVQPLARLLHSDSADVQSAAGRAIGKLVMEPAARMALINSSTAARQQQ